VWVGPDDRGVVPEVIAVDLPDHLLVIHAMPLAFRSVPGSVSVRPTLRVGPIVTHSRSRCPSEWAVAWAGLIDT
jgi:hypothetical protein